MVQLEGFIINWVFDLVHIFEENELDYYLHLEFRVAKFLELVISDKFLFIIDMTFGELYLINVECILGENTDYIFELFFVMIDIKIGSE